MSDIRDHYDHGPIVRKPEPVDGGMRVTALVVALVVLASLAVLFAVMGPK